MLFGFGLLTFSCTNDLENFSNVTNSGEKEETVVTRGTSNMMKFTYHGKMYETDCIVARDSIISYTNSEFDNIVKKLRASRGNFVTFLHSNGVTELFDNQSDFESNKDRLMTQHKKEKNSSSIQNSQRALFPEDNKPYLAPKDPENNEVEIHMYEDQLYWGDWTLLKRTKRDSDYQQVAKEWNYSGDATSMIVHSIGCGGWLTFYENMGCQGDSFSIIIDIDDRISIPEPYEWGEAHPNNPKFGSLYIMDLRGVHFIGTSGDWNDRIHSIRVERYIGGGGIM